MGLDAVSDFMSVWNRRIEGKLCSYKEPPTGSRSKTNADSKGLHFEGSLFCAHFIIVRLNALGEVRHFASSHFLGGQPILFAALDSHQ
jgi:hypothetical protein